MSSQISDVPAPFSPLVKLNLPSPEEYRKRKVALVSGEPAQAYSTRLRCPDDGDCTQVSLARMALTCKYINAA